MELPVSTAPVSRNPAPALVAVPPGIVESSRFGACEGRSGPPGSRPLSGEPTLYIRGKSGSIIECIRHFL